VQVEETPNPQHVTTLIATSKLDLDSSFETSDICSAFANAPRTRTAVCALWMICGLTEHGNEHEKHISIAALNLTPEA